MTPIPLAGAAWAVPIVTRAVWRLLAHVDSQTRALGRILPLDRYQQRECHKSASLQYRRLELLLARLEKLPQIVLRNRAPKGIQAPAVNLRGLNDDLETGRLLIYFWSCVLNRDLRGLSPCPGGNCSGTEGLLRRDAC